MGTTNDKKENASQILGSASNLLGFCFIVLTSLKFFNLTTTTLIDEGTAVCFVIFMVSCLFAFLSIRSKSKLAELYGTLAEYSFLAGLFIIFLMTILFIFEIIY